MLTRIRERASGWIAWAIVILISIPFALWGVNSYFQGTSKIIVASADGTEIEQQTYQQALVQQQRTLVQFAGRNFDPEFFSSDEFKMQAIDQLIDQTLQRGYIRSRRYHISDRELNLQIQEIPAFHTDGIFDVERYENLVGRAGFSISGFEEQQRQEAAFNQVKSGIAATAIAPESSTDNLLKLLRQKRDARYVVVELSSYSDRIIVTAQDIESQYQENSNDYFFPAELQVDYVLLSVNELAEGIVLDQEEIRSVYDEHIDRFIQPESRFVRHILVGLDGEEEGETVRVARETAADIASQIRGGDDFAMLAEEISDDVGSARQGGDLGIIQPGTMPILFEEAAASLLQGQISEPVRTQYGFHVIQVYRLIEETQEPYENVRDQIATDIRRKEAEVRFVEMAEDFRNISYEQADSLNPVADALELEIKRSDWFSADYGVGFFENVAVREAAFSDFVLLDELNSKVVEFDLDTLAVMRKAEYRERRLQPLPDVKSKIMEQILRERAISTLGSDGLSFVKMLNIGSILWSQLLLNQQWEGQELSLLVGDQDEALNSSIRSLIYAAPPPKGGQPIYGSGWLNSSSFLIYELSSVIDGDSSSVSQAEREQMRKLILRRDGADLLINFQQGLRAAADVKIYRDQL
jgi:peptidyl-prolyl cis-trans isomerase D